MDTQSFSEGESAKASSELFFNSTNESVINLACICERHPATALVSMNANRQDYLHNGASAGSYI